MCVLLSAQSFAGMLFDAFPTHINPDEKYVFYSHGYIVEGTNPRPEHAVWGIYDFPLITQTLAGAEGNLIAYHRPAQTDPFAAAQQLAQDVQQLIAAGVKPQNITLMGFSRGGAITIMAANELKLDNLKTVILAGCAGLVKDTADLQLYGDVLSVFETSDQVGSCEFLHQRSDQVRSFTEIAISTGKSHGAFYLPRPQWVTPVMRWIEHTSQYAG